MAEASSEQEKIMSAAGYDYSKFSADVEQTKDILLTMERLELQHSLDIAIILVARLIVEAKQKTQGYEELLKFFEGAAANYANLVVSDADLGVSSTTGQPMIPINKVPPNLQKKEIFTVLYADSITRDPDFMNTWQKEYLENKRQEIRDFYRELLQKGIPTELAKDIGFAPIPGLIHILKEQIEISRSQLRGYGLEEMSLEQRVERLNELLAQIQQRKEQNSEMLFQYYTRRVIDSTAAPTLSVASETNVPSSATRVSPIAASTNSMKL